MYVLIACEESQRVCIAFRERGHIAFSCDIDDFSGGHPEWHIKQDVLPLLDGFCSFKTCDGVEHNLNQRWDMIIAFPPCTYLTNTGNRWFNIEKYGEKAIERHKLREEAIIFFMAFVNANCERIIIENPIGVMSSKYKKPTQIIQPYFFGDAARKSTCLWIKGVAPLKPTNIVEPEIYYYKAKNGRIKSDSRWRGSMTAKERSKTFPGIAAAMAMQWG